MPSEETTRTPAKIRKVMWMCVKGLTKNFVNTRKYMFIPAVCVCLVLAYLKTHGSPEIPWIAVVFPFWIGPAILVAFIGLVVGLGLAFFILWLFVMAVLIVLDWIHRKW